MATYPTDPKIQFPINKTPIWDTSIVKYKGMSEKRKANFSAERWEFNFSYRSLTSTEKNTILNFYMARYGSYESFTFVNPDPNDAGSYIVRFDNPTLDIVYIDYDLYNINNINLIEAVGET